MRISDWSSDVCSSDLKFGHIGDAETRPIGAAQADILVDPPVDTQLVIPVAAEQVIIRKAHRAVDRQRFEERRVGEHGNRKLKIGFLGRGRARDRILLVGVGDTQHRQRIGIRSEEHTSELQSLMRISYAVFCLKKKKKKIKS